MSCNEKIQRLLLLAAVVVGVAVYALFTAEELAALTILLPAIAIVGLVGLIALLLASSISCGCDNVSFCGVGVLAAIGGAGSILAALLTAVAGVAAGTGYRIGVAVSFALLTLLLGGIIGLLAQSHDCVSCNCRCSCDDDDDDEPDCSQARVYYRR